MSDGEYSMDLGKCTDVIDGCPKHTAIMMLLRAMTPDVIAVDEIGSKQDAEAIGTAALSGVKILATSHGRNVSDVKSMRYMQPLLETFEKFIILGGTPGRVLSIIDNNNLASKKAVNAP